MSAFPQPFISTVSHWQATNRGITSLWDHNREVPLPPSADIVIIGGGISGASLAYQLTRARSGQKIVLLEAKDLASGATGRNGGHIAPASFTMFPTLTAPLSAGGSGLTDIEALAVLDNEIETLEYATEVIRKEHLDVDLWRGKKLEVKISAAGVAGARKAWERYMEARKQSPQHKEKKPEWEFIDDPKQAKEISRTASALAVLRGPAGSCHPHKLATALMRLAMEDANFDFYSWSPVKDVQRSQGGWSVSVHGRGSIKAGKVILCTNGHTRNLLPGDNVAKHITPFRGQAALVVPPASYSGSKMLKSSYALEAGPYLMSTPHSGVVLGVYNATALAAGIARKKDIFEVTDDSTVLPSFKKWLGDYCAKTFDNWGKESQGEGISRVWSGIMGASRDHLPLIGEVPGKAGLYAAVAFHGHGMARILTATRGLAHLLDTGDWDPRLPKSFVITDERLKNAREQAPELITQEEMNEGEEQKGLKNKEVQRHGLRDDVMPVAKL